MTIARITCDGGLDLVTAKGDAAPGTLRDCLNYEVGNRRGYQKSKGLLGYSGGTVNDVIDPYLFYHTPSNGSNATLSGAAFNHGMSVKWGSGGTFRLSDGTLTTYDGRGLICYVGNITGITNAIYGLCAIEGRLPMVGDTITRIAGGAQTAVMTDDIALMSNATTLPFPSVAATVDGFTPLIRTSDAEKAFLGGNGYPVPCAMNGYVSGGFYWKDRLFVVSDLEEWSFTAGSVEPSVGDIVRVYSVGTFNTGTFTAGKVEAVITSSGSWSAGTAAGQLILAPRQEGTGQQVYGVTATDFYNETTAADSPLTLGARLNPTRAALWRDGGPYESNSAWERMDLGHEIRFRVGTNFPVVLNRANRDPELETTVTTTAWTACGTGAGTGWSSPTNIQGATDAAVATFSGNPAESPPIKATNFGFTIPSTAVILGVEMRFTRREDSSFTANDYEVVLNGVSGTSQNKAKAAAWPGALTLSDVYGSASDNWGVSLSGPIVTAADFGVSIRAVRSGGTPVEFEIDSVEMRVTYKDRSSTYYFYDTTTAADVSSGRLIWYYKDKGDWDTDDAEGVATFYSLSSASAIRDGHQIRSAAAGGGNLIATVGSAANKVYLDASPALDSNESQYEFAIGNFFSAATTEQVFGVSGAGFAFSWDGNYLIRIRTGVEANSDKPRHVAKHLDQLILGYGAGVCMASDLGYPESFSGVTDGSSPISDDGTTYPTFAGGAQEIPCGDPVHGLMPLAEQSLGVFCARSIRQIVGSGGSLVTNLIEGSSGIIEYTLANIGIPVFCDFRGIGTVTATDAFGDFARGRLSDSVSPWLLPRLQEAGPAIATNRGPIRAEIVRFKNQYRVYFRDRKVLTMTMVGNDFSNPQFSLQEVPFVPTMLCSGVSSTGKDRIFAGTYGPANVGANSNLLIAPTTQLAGQYVPPKVYELEVGTSWDRLLPIDGYIELNAGAVGTEYQNKKFDRMIVSGLMYGFAPFGANFGVNFGDLETGTPVNINAGSTSASPAKAFAEQPFSVVKEVSRRGFAIAIKFVSEGDNAYGATTTQTSPYAFRPHTIQSVLVVYENENIRR